MSNKKDIYKKSNYLIQAKYELTEMEQKVLQLAISKINERDDELKTYSLTVKEFIKKSKADNSEVYNHIAEAVKRLMDRSLTFLTIEGNIEQFKWVSYAKYFKEDKSRVEIGFDSRLKPYLLLLQDNYTKLNLDITMKFKSIYSSRIYELLAQYLKLRSRKITILQIKEFLGLIDLGDTKYSEKYPVYADFKKVVLNKAITEINEMTDLDVTFQEITKESSRKIIAIKFFIKLKDEIAMTALPTPDENLEKLIKELKKDFIENDIITIYEESKKDYEKVKIAYEKFKIYPDVQNSVGLMIYFVRQKNLKSPTKEEKQKIKKNKANFEQREYTQEDFKKLEEKLLGRD